jgi:chaperonin GroES
MAEFDSWIRPVSIIPLGDRIIVRRLKEAEKTKGGIYIAEIAQEKACYGVAIGCGESVENYWLRKPVIVAFDKYAGTVITVDGEVLLVLSEGEVTGIVCDGQLIRDLVLKGA